MSQPLESKRSLFPRSWRIGVSIGLAIGYLVGLVDQASSYVVFSIVVLLAVASPLCRHALFGSHRFARRALPLLGFLVVLGGLVSIVRVDDLTGNLIPTRLSFRWQPRADELLARHEPAANTGLIDLRTETANDFPEFLGPGRMAYAPASWSEDWTSQAPELVWKKSTFGAGWSGFVAVNGYAITLEQRGPEEQVNCYEVESGDLVWTSSFETRHTSVLGGVGPRSTPTVHEGRVYSLGATGQLMCLDGANGEVIWQKNLLEQISMTVEQDVELVTWGRAASPLLDDSRVIVPLGGPNGPSLAAYDAESGAELWRHGKHQVSYASPMIATLDDQRQIIIVCQNFVCGHDAATGEQLWEYEWPGLSNSGASCSQPVVAGADRLFLSKGYAHGSALVEVTQADGRWNAKTIWHRRTVMKTKFTNVVLHEGHVYGLDDSMLACVELDTGQIRWRKRAGYGHGQVLRVGDHLLVQAESGDVALVALAPNAFTELARLAAIDGKTWNNPCVHGEYLLVRNGEQAACYRMPRK